MHTPTTKQLAVFAATAEARITWRIWDGVSPVGDADAAYIRREYGGGTIYQILDGGTPVYTQGHAPGVAGNAVMTQAEAESFAGSHATEIRQRIVEALSSDAMAPWVSLRAERSTLLAQADHLINTAEDAGGDTAALRKYRQQLRDITTGLKDPADVMWPAKP